MSRENNNEFHVVAKEDTSGKSLELLLGQHVILYVEILNEKSNRIDLNLILCPNHEVERDIITKMRNISSLNINIMGESRFARPREDIMSDPNPAIRHFVNNTLSFVGLDDADIAT